MTITPIDIVTDEILALLEGIPQTTDPDTAKRQAIRAIVERIHSMVLSCTVTVNGNTLVAADPVSGPLPVSGMATGALS